MARAPPLQGGCRGFKSLWAHVNKPTANELAEIIEVRYPKSLAVEWDVVGFVTTTETTDVLDGILGYKNSDGALVFSTVIDGGGY